MSDERIGDRELEAALRDVGARLRYPPSADLVPAVRARIGTERAGGLWALLRAPRVAFVPALATLALLLAATLAFQPIAATAAEALGLGRLIIFRSAATPSPAPTRSAQTPAPQSAVLADARRVASVEEASREAGFAVLVPAALGVPDEVHVRSSSQGATVFLVYAPRSDIPAAKQTGIGVLVTQAPGTLEKPLLGKVLTRNSRLEEVTVNGRPGVWIEGAPHQMFFRGASGEFVTDTLRLAGNVLAWDQGGVFVRLEADLVRDRALAVASSMR